MKNKKIILVIGLVVIATIIVGVTTRIYINRNPLLSFEVEDIESIRVEIRPGEEEVMLSDEQIKEFLNCIQKVRMDNDYFEYGDEVLRYNFIIERSNGKKYIVRHILNDNFKVDGVTYKGTSETVNEMMEFEKKL